MKECDMMVYCLSDCVMITGWQWLQDNSIDIMIHLYTSIQPVTQISKFISSMMSNNLPTLVALSLAA
jgi:hypothetical protein